MELLHNKHLILFDGICNLCNASIQYVIKHDKKDVFRFTPIQSEVGRKVIKDFQINTKKTDSIILYSKKRISYKSSAVLKIAMVLGLPISIFGVFWIVPPFIRNWVYDYIAKNRYKWYGKRESCMVPTQETESKFI